MSGCCWISVLTSSATVAASCAGVLGAAAKMRSVSHRNSSTWVRNNTASIAMNPNAIFQYRLRYQTGSDIGELVSRAPHGQHEFRIGGIVLDLPAHAFDQRVDAALGDVRVVSPDLLHQRVAAEDDAAIGRQQIQEIEFMRGQLDLAVRQACVTARRIDRQAAGDDRSGMAGRTRWPAPE